MERIVNIGPNTRMAYLKVRKTGPSRILSIPASWGVRTGVKIEVMLISADGTTRTSMTRWVSFQGNCNTITIPFKDASWAEVGDMVHVIAEVMEDDDTGREIEGGTEVAPADA